MDFKQELSDLLARHSEENGTGLSEAQTDAVAEYIIKILDAQQRLSEELVGPLLEALDEVEQG